jgi:hypothetical protein
MSISYRQSDNTSISTALPKAVCRFSQSVHDAEAKIFSDILAISHMGFLSCMFLLIEWEFGFGAPVFWLLGSIRLTHLKGVTLSISTV